MTIEQTTTVEDLARRLTALEEELAATRRLADRGAVDNVFNRYMHYHNAYRDELADVLVFLVALSDALGVDVVDDAVTRIRTAVERSRPQPTTQEETA